MQENRSILYFVLHVKVGYEDRERFMQTQLENLKINFQWVLEHDMSELDPVYIAAHFTKEMEGIQPAVSCAMKHIQAWKNVMESDAKGAVIFEDDMVLHADFNNWINRFILEAEQKVNENKSKVFISLENSLLTFIPSSQKIEGRYLYPAKNPRCAGAYYLSKEAAGLLYRRFLEQAMEVPVDWWMGNMVNELGITLYWSEPTVAEQGSHNGMFRSGIDDKPKSVFRRINFIVQKGYKKLLSRFR